MEFDDARRLNALRDYRVLDTPAEPVFDNITALASRLFHTPIALVSLIDEKRQWFKSRFGLDVSETARDVAFCDHAIRESGPMVVTDASQDPRFAQNPLVTGPPDIRFYCGVPLRTPDGQALGTLCLIDRVPREIHPDAVHALEILAHQVELELEAHRRLKLLEEGLVVQRREQRGKELLAAMVVHDLRNPSTSITLIATYLAEQHPNMEELREILDESDRMQRMLADVLDVCLAEVHSLRPRRRQFALPAMVRQVARRFARMTVLRGQSIALDLPADRDVLVDADPNLVDRTITNLLQNAIKHGPARQPIKVRVLPRSGHVRVEVADMGQTIDGVLRDSIFRPFEQLGEPSTGYGLGLAFCQIAVAAHGGTIGVTAEDRQGNCFWFELPME